MKKRDLIPLSEMDEDAEDGWMVQYDANGARGGKRAEWESVIEDTRQLAHDAEAGTISQVRVGNRWLRFVSILFSRQGEKTAEKHPNANPRPPTLADVERALENFYDVHALAQNPLTHALHLSRHQRASEPAALAKGYALQRALNEALDHYTGAAPRTIHDKGLRIQHYLHFHYREEISHNDLADALDYDRRHVRRLRAECIREFAEVLVALNAPR